MDDTPCYQTMIGCSRIWLLIETENIPKLNQGALRIGHALYDDLALTLEHYMFSEGAVED